ncbi:polyamine oxidase [Lichtheimia corymbifera JMRC:FSU:9682]|uniref:Polyamine oxidase n=1 Tax=Lichtheimia corymbifera JMRC:FSU:9682 TaxID=1263082 RepID=A0A068SCZ3_9FUNG|nr:polyamine oxidase [Lichtheimia corymbifera JMRC:FSU:9682]
MDVSATSYRTKVVILGAGASGVAAASTLHKNGQDDFIIVEGQSFVGGRVQHATLGRSSVELGANWIYGKGTNPIYKLATQHGLKTAPNDKRDVAFFDDQGPLRQRLGLPVYDAFDELMEKTVMYAEERIAHNQVDLSSRAALRMLGWEPDTPLKAAVEYFAIEWELAEPAEVSSLEYATGTSDMTEGTFPFGNEFVVDHRGFNYILQEEANRFLKPNDSRLLLDTMVTRVQYDGPHGVIVHTANGDHIFADYAICTFSLGVLQSDSVEWIPAFPDWKREALLSFHMTTYTKIFLRFDHKFWDDWQFALYAGNDTREYTVWQNLNAPGYLPHQNQDDDNILMVTATYKASERLERLPDAQVADEIMQVLQRMFPHKSLPRPTGIVVPRWHTNPLFRGSYSNWPIGMLVEHHENMRAPLPIDDNDDAPTFPRLWFAGEAMSPEYYGYLHGAWIEGQNIAGKILECLYKTCPPYRFHKRVRACNPTPRFRLQQ